MQRTYLPGSIFAVFLISVAYWLYLSFNTRMDIAYDSIGYEQLGRLLQHQGFISYFKTGPNREPVYPALITTAMHWENLSGFAYTRIMAFFGVLILFISQLLLYRLLCLLNIRTGIAAAALLYFALSPAVNNTAFSLYSEIAAYPFILGIVLTSHRLWRHIEENNLPQSIGWGAFLGALAALMTLTKAVFECIVPAGLLILFLAALFSKKKPAVYISGILAAACFFYVPITDYKALNQRYNGSFAITNRASWALYGNTARRMEPLTVKRLMTALAYAPGQGVCESVFGEKECFFWSFSKSDDYGMRKGKLPDAAFMKMSTDLVLKNPIQYVLLMAIEASKMFFWESTQIGFVGYPPWLAEIYDNKIFNNLLRLLTAVMTVAGMFFIWREFLRRRSPALVNTAGAVIFLYIFFYSFFYILTRYTLPIVPLYLAIISYAANVLASHRFKMA